MRESHNVITRPLHIDGTGPFVRIKSDEWAIEYAAGIQHPKRFDLIELTKTEIAGETVYECRRGSMARHREFIGTASKR